MTTGPRYPILQSAEEFKTVLPNETIARSSRDVLKILNAGLVLLQLPHLKLMPSSLNNQIVATKPSNPEAAQKCDEKSLRAF
ncbi:hypothetical protein ACMFMF_011888 [Clarireedia jacksonii]